MSSELRATEPETQLLTHIRPIEFSAKAVEQMALTWPVDFLPSQAPSPGHGARIAHPFAGTTAR